MQSCTGFSGTLKVAEQAVEDGHSFSFNPAMARSSKGQSLLAILPPERVLLETDGPYVMVGGSKAGPPHLPPILTQLAATWSLTTSEARQIAVNNQQRLLGNPSG